MTKQGRAAARPFIFSTGRDRLSQLDWRFEFEEDGVRHAIA